MSASADSESRRTPRCGSRASSATTSSCSATACCSTSPTRCRARSPTYLFEAADLPFADLVDDLLAIAIAEAREERSTTRVFESALLGMHVGTRR